MLGQRWLSTRSMAPSTSRLRSKALTRYVRASESHPAVRHVVEELLDGARVRDAGVAVEERGVGGRVRGRTRAEEEQQVVLTGVLTAFLVALLLFLSLGVTTGRLLQYKEVHQEGREYHCYQELVRWTLGPGKRGQWTWKDPACAAWLLKLSPLFEDLRDPPKYMLSQITGGGGPGKERIIVSEDENEDAKAPFLQKLFGSSSSDHSSRAHAVVVLAIASFQLFFMVLKKPFIKKRVQLVEILALASEVFVFAAYLRLIDSGGADEGSGLVLAMLTVFTVAFTTQVCNEWNALYRQVRLLSSDRSSFPEGAKAAWVGLLLLPSSALGDELEKMKQEQPGPPCGAAGVRKKIGIGQKNG
ncbi:hypothetical protein E2562_020173 [Oryza meyeriana var. granulata]|uniref:Uncharacterized protein n=1 Tax=Oryza meyeriana var. granulata TaxID=110450 RepID=A0A6G1BKT6_9ORYZ|nr:hypothetical protein E2562_020173 [Oryza meyeriana var. granulata]